MDYGHLGTLLACGYCVHEHIALYQNNSPALSDYERVLCHDLSQKSVSFFRHEPLPADKLLIITLSQSTQPIYMVASVVYSRPTIVRGEDLYRIGCRFIRRLEGAPGEEAACVTPVAHAHSSFADPLSGDSGR